ncbi:MAG: rod shape-determining protein [Eubacteriales bacterium]|nr:rod shape-determining protein [Eubacteriales bacterium]
MSLKRTCGVDLGSDAIKITDNREKQYLCEKNIIAIRQKTHVIALGDRAWEIFEKAPADVYAGYPVRDGALAEGKNQELILAYLVKKFATFFTKHPNLYVTAPSDISQVERRAYYKILSGGLGAKRIWMVEKGIADAAGLGMPMDDPSGNMIVNLGGGHTEISVISEGKIILNRVLRLGGQKLDEEIAGMVRRQYQLHIGSRTAEELKNTMASIGQIPEKSAKIYGIHTVTGLPAAKEISALSVSVAILETIEQITEAVHTMLERTPPQLLADIRKAGIYLTGGVSQIPGLAWSMQSELEIPVYNVQDPVSCGVRGLVRIMNDPALRKTLCFSLKEFAGNTI